MTNYTPRHLEYSDFHLYNPPEDQNDAYTRGTEYFEQYLRPVMSGLINQVESLRTEVGCDDSKVAVVFLDRDSRPALHSWKAYTSQKKYTAIPLPVSSTLMPLTFDTYVTFAERHLSDYHDPESWSEAVGAEFDRYPLFNETQVWISTFQNELAARLNNKDLIITVDIGYRGSAAEVSRYLLAKAFPQAQVKSLLLYKFDDFIPTRGIISGQTTHYAETSIPHTVVGYSHDEQKGQFHYLHTLNTQEETLFYKGVREAATKQAGLGS